MHASVMHLIMLAPTMVMNILSTVSLGSICTKYPQVQRYLSYLCVGCMQLHVYTVHLYSSVYNIQHEEVFFDASTATIVKKKWKKLPAAEPTDSRVVWQHVTDAILREDEQGAADAKHEVYTIVYQLVCEVPSEMDFLHV